MGRLQGTNVDVLSKVGRSAAELSLENSQAEIAKFISEYKANANTRNKLPPMTLDTVQYDARKDGQDEAKICLHGAVAEGNVDTLKLLFEWGEDINARNVSNQTPLHIAAAKGNVGVVCVLIELGAEVDPCDGWGRTPLHWTTRFGYLEVSRVLLDRGANVNARKHDHWTPMHISARCGYLEIVKLLLECGADVDAMNEEGETPYQLSLRAGFREIADLLRKHGAGRFGERSDESFFDLNA